MPKSHTNFRGHKWTLLTGRQNDLQKLDHIRANFSTVPDADIDTAKNEAIGLWNDPKIQTPEHVRLMAGRDFLYAFSHDDKLHAFMATKTNSAATCRGEFDLHMSDKLSFQDVLIFNQI